MSSEKNVLNFLHREKQKKKKNPHNSLERSCVFGGFLPFFFVGNVYICFSFLRTFLQ